jgi:hypothetical protein
MRLHLKKITSFIALCTFVLVLIAPSQAFAQKGSANPGSKGGPLQGTIGEEVTSEDLDALNPLKQYSSNAEELSTPGGILSRFLTIYAFPIAGLILFVMLLWGGFEMLLGAADKKSIDAGKQRITAALIGFLILFTSYWIARLLEMMFGINIL